MRIVSVLSLLFLSFVTSVEAGPKPKAAVGDGGKAAAEAALATAQADANRVAAALTKLEKDLTKITGSYHDLILALRAGGLPAETQKQVHALAEKANTSLKHAESSVQEAKKQASMANSRLRLAASTIRNGNYAAGQQDIREAAIHTSRETTDVTTGQLHAGAASVDIAEATKKFKN